MSNKDKLIKRFLSFPSDFHFDELIKLLRIFGFHEVRTGRTSGSRVKFVNQEGLRINLHRPHPGGILKIYQMKQVKEFLGL